MDGSEELSIRLPYLFFDGMAGEYPKVSFYEKVKPVAEPLDRTVCPADMGRDFKTFADVEFTV
jgi:hypothetical protein